MIPVDSEKKIDVFRVAEIIIPGGKGSMPVSEFVTRTREIEKRFGHLGKVYARNIVNGWEFVLEAKHMEAFTEWMKTQPDSQPGQVVSSKLSE